jgi:hypothetical protein
MQNVLSNLFGKRKDKEFVALIQALWKIKPFGRIC